MSLQGIPIGSQHVSTNGGANQPSAKKLRVQDPDGREPSLQDGEQYTDASGNGQQHPHGERSQEAVEGEGGPQLTTDPENMTDTVSAGIYMMQTRKKAVETKIDELIKVGTQYLESLKQQFVQKLEGVKGEICNYHDSQIQEWTSTSAATTEAAVRLHQARQLVESLGLHANKAQ